MRRLTTFTCGGETLVATLDTAGGATGLLIVSGGNEIRIGAHRGMALLAQKLAARGVPVFRYDRRGIGDSTGENGGFLTSGPDIAAAAAAFRAEAGVDRIVGFGNCDAASALALFGAEAGIDRLILANPWVIERQDDLPPAAAIRARYAEKLRDPREWLRLARGGVNLRKLAGGLTKLATRKPQQDASLAARLIAALGEWNGNATILLARSDNTAIAFADAVHTVDFAVPIHALDSDSHSFARAGDAAWLEEQIVAALARA